MKLSAFRKSKPAPPLHPRPFQAHPMYPIHLSSGMTSCSVFRTVLRSVLCWMLLGALLPNGAQAQRMPQDTWYLAKEFFVHKLVHDSAVSIPVSITDVPTGIAVDADGTIYISFGNVICKIDEAYNFLQSFWVDFAIGGFAVGANKRLYAVDSRNNYVQIFDLDGKSLGKFGGAGSGDGQFSNAASVSVSNNGTVFVMDSGNYRVQAFDADGKFLFKFGKQGSFYGEFTGPNAIAVSRDGRVAVADFRNRVQIFDSNGSFLSQLTQIGDASANALCFLSDGLLCVKGGAQGQPSNIRVYSPSGDLLKEWDYNKPAFLGGSFLAGTTSGDIIVDNGFSFSSGTFSWIGGFTGLSTEGKPLSVWKRTYRLAQPEPGNAVPLPSILSQARRPGTSLVDVDYIVKDADDATVQTAALAFKNGGNSLADVIPLTSFAEGSGVQLGTGISTGAVHRFTWDVTKDWATDFGEVQLEILAKDKRGLLNLDFIRIPADKGLPELKISRSPLNDTDFLSVWYWLVATGDSGISLLNGDILPRDWSTSPYASGTTTTSSGRAYLFNKMGLREATPEEVKRAKEAGNPGVINQWEPKTRRVGPDERPAFINSYGFDTGADGFWVVPVTK